ncbi:ATP-binding protein [Shewanella psychrotolerans]|uniref:ATP-binding protein n=1 Tax=Shewanella psychrotolerans TaxID=2864206 RepID=UPI001C65922F|nr:ATP-binding protein [Shewanella psychrotolerans]QYK03152.1 ATP-binding protein [Shewanella psychrotolerans]
MERLMAALNRIDMPDNIAKHCTLKAAWKAMNHVHYNFTHQDKKLGLLITGPSGIGKTLLAETYASQIKRRESEEKVTIPVLHHEVAIETNSPSALLRGIIMRMGAPLPRKAIDFIELFAQFNQLLVELEVELLIIDEVQHTLPKNDGIKAQQMLKCFASMLDKSGVPIVFMGTQAANRLMTFGTTKKDYDDDEQLSRRMIKPVKLHQIIPISKESLNVFNYFMARENLPLLQSNERELITRLNLAYINGHFGTLDKLFKGYDFSYVHDRIMLLDALRESFELNCPCEANPFNEQDYNAMDATLVVEKHKVWVNEWRAEHGYPTSMPAK